MKPKSSREILELSDEVDRLHDNVEELRKKNAAKEDRIMKCLEGLGDQLVAASDEDLKALKSSGDWTPKWQTCDE